MSVSRPGFLPAQAFIRSVLIVSNSGRFCCCAVLISDIKTAVARAPRSLRLPPVIFRITTAGRRARSAGLCLLQLRPPTGTPSACPARGLIRCDRVYDTLPGNIATPAADA